MTAEDVLVVGPAGDETGGIARYISEQRRQLPDHVGVRVHDTDTGSHDGPVALARAALASAADFARVPLRRRPDVVHVHTSHRRSFYRKAAYVLLADRVWDRPVVLHVHGSSFDDFLETDSRAARALQRRVFDACDAVVVLSSYWRDVLSDVVDPEALHVVPNAVDASEYDPVYERERPHVVFLSTMYERKGIGEFVDAVDALLDGDGPRFDVTIAGKGPESGRAATLAARHDAVDYRGFVDEPEKRRLLSRGTIYALPTHAEGLPFAILEAMAGGNAVVSTPVGSIPSVVDDDVGRLVPPGDPDALAGELEDLVAAPETVVGMGRRSRERVVEGYSWTAAADQLTAIYDDVTDAGRTGRREPPTPDVDAPL